MAATLVAVFAVRLVNEVASGCSESAEFTVDADPSIAPALTDLVRNELPDVTSDARCLRPKIRATESALTAERLAAQSKASNRPDVWIPDSSIWLDRVRTSYDRLPGGKSVASSPVVLATTEKTATEAGWPERNPSWSELLGGVGVAGTAEPTSDANAAFALIGIDQLKWSAVDRTRSIQALTKHTFPSADKPYEHLPGGSAQPTVATFPSSEQAVLRRNASAEAGSIGSVVAAYPETQTPWLDYPAVVLDGLPQDRKAAAERFQQVLSGPLASATLAKYGFRDPDGVLTGEGAADKRVNGQAGERVPPPSSRQATALLQRWATLSAASRMVVALDVSESMIQKVKGTNSNRMEIALATVSDALRLLRPTTEVALWEFSTLRDGARPYKELVPYKPMKQHIADGLPDRIGELISGPAGGTGLYDTTLAAVQAAQDGWDPAKLNLVLVVTDGQNHNPKGISKQKLLNDLKTVADPERPTRVIFVGLGTEVDGKELTDIAKVTGGQVHLSRDIKKAKELFFTILRGLAQPPG